MTYFDRQASVPDFFNLGPSMIGDGGMQQTLWDVGAPLSPFHYQLRKVNKWDNLRTGLESAISRGEDSRTIQDTYLRMGRKAFARLKSDLGGSRCRC